MSETHNNQGGNASVSGMNQAGLSMSLSSIQIHPDFRVDQNTANGQSVLWVGHVQFPLAPGEQLVHVRYNKAGFPMDGLVKIGDRHMDLWEWMRSKIDPTNQAHVRIQQLLTTRHSLGPPTEVAV